MKRWIETLTVSWTVFTGAFWDLLFPPPVTCPGCKNRLSAKEQHICDSCHQKILLISEPACRVCGRPVSYPGLCQDCGPDSHPYVQAWSATIYDGVIRECIHCFKYEHGGHLAPFLSTLIVNRLEQAGGLPRELLVVPVPLDRHRLRQRGYNQSLLLAKEVAKSKGWTLAVGSLRRVRFTQPQATLGKKERHRNVQGAFQVISPKTIQGKEILLIDDIYTTGATVDAVGHALKQAGAGDVYVATVAMALGPG